MDKLSILCKEMIAYDKGDPRRIHHFLKVHAFARQIGIEEGLDAQILAEADMLVNQYESGATHQQNEALYHRLYKTEAGKRIYREMYFETYEGMKS